MKTITLLVALVCIYFPVSSLAQAEIKVTNPGVSINDNGNNSQDPNAVLHINSDNKGVMFPHLDTETRDAIQNPSPGLLIFNSDNCVYEYFNGSSWQAIGIIPIQDTPIAPSNLLAEMISETQISLTWTDNSTNESGFMIERATSSDFSTGLSSFSIAENATSYLDNIPSGQNAIYHYRIKALNGCASSNYIGDTQKLAYFPQNHSDLYASFDARIESNFDFDGTPTFPPGVVGQLATNWKSPAQNIQLTGTSNVDPTFFKPGGYSLTLNGRNTLRTSGGSGSPHLIAQAYEDYNFLHQGNQDFTIVVITEPEGQNSKSTFIAMSSMNQGSNTGFGIFEIGALHHSVPNKALAIIKYGSNSLALYSSGNVAHDELNILVARFEASTKTFRLMMKNSRGTYNDSVDGSSFTYATGNSTRPFTIFNHNSAPSAGKMSQFQIWKSVLSDTEVNEIANLLYEYYQ